ncbi:hypothetical protein LP419_21210 [Massilia sp. H-1]|nr:hypothetical protein LP419_21210 [Massilia sp. H-1]
MLAAQLPLFQALPLLCARAVDDGAAGAAAQARAAAGRGALGPPAAGRLSAVQLRADALVAALLAKPAGAPVRGVDGGAAVAGA